MNAKISLRILAVLGATAFVYFVMYPEDVTTVTAPITAVIAPMTSVIELSRSVSPWLYMLVAVGIVTWAVVRVWGQRRTVQ